LANAGYDLTSQRVDTPADMKVALESSAWDVILCDYSMPQFDAIRALELLKRLKLDIPFIIISGTVGEAVAVAAMRAGASDYLMKDNLVRLGPTIERELQEASNRRARQLAESQLRYSEERYRRLLETSNEGVWVVDAKLRTTYVNERLAEMLGVKVAEMIGHSALEFLNEQAKVDVLNRWHHRTLGLREQYDLHFVRRDGSEAWAIVCATPIFDEHDKFSGALSMLTDITKRKRAEEEEERLTAEVANQRQRLDNIISTVPGVVWEAWGQPDAANQQINFVNAYVEKMLGYSVEEWLSGPNFWLSIVHPEDKERAAQEAAANFRVGKSSTSEFRWVAKDGRAIWVESNYIVIGDDQGNPIGVRGVTIDITERRRTEEALRQSEERYRDLVENAHDIIYSHDLDGNYTSVNAAVERITGYTVIESLSLNLSQTIASSDIPKAREMLRRKLAGEKVTAYELDIIAKDGHRVSVEVNTKLVFENGVPVAVQGIARDVTERKQLEEQLRQSQKMEAIGQLAGGVAHDFNNLLTAINGYSSLALLRMKEDNDTVRGYLEEVRKAGDRAANLTRQLLAFGRKQMLQPVPINLNDVVADLNKMLRRLIGEDIELTAKFEPELGRIKADPGQIEQVLVNLVVNARDAMPKGGTLTIETSNFEVDNEYAGKHVGVDRGKYIMLAVSDTGTGIDEKTRVRIFEPFFTTKEKGKGTGLGLSTVYGIVKQSGGNIWVYSEPGQGTVFKIYLPQIETDVVVPEKKPVELAAPTGSETILLVEDEQTVRWLAREILEAAGYTVLDTGSGKEAFRLIRERAEPIHLLLTDVVMPETSGKEIAERLRAERPQVRVLFMSGYTDEAIVNHGILDAAVQFIQKPFTPVALTRKVREVLDSDENGST